LRKSFFVLVLGLIISGWYILGTDIQMDSDIFWDLGDWLACYNMPFRSSNYSYALRKL
jgi:hypothetical protein